MKIMEKNREGGRRKKKDAEETRKAGEASVKAKWRSGMISDSMRGSTGLDEFGNVKGEVKKGFTLIEILLVMGIIAILAAVVIVAINPARQFAQARNSQRTSNVFSILNAISQNMADHGGVFDCPAGAIPTTATVIKSTGGYNASDCLVPTYLPALPFDPSASGAHFTSSTDYDSGYMLVRDTTTGRITISAPEAQNPSELNKTISATR